MVEPLQGSFEYPLIIPLFEMLLMNILTNAVKYNAAENPSLRITFERDDRELRIRFADNGIGMEAAELKKVFRKFYQGQRDDRTVRGGSGIGLYLVQQIARLHRGRMVAASEGPGRGSVFTLILPEPGQ